MHRVINNDVGCSNPAVEGNVTTSSTTEDFVWLTGTATDVGVVESTIEAISPDVYLTVVSKEGKVLLHIWVGTKPLVDVLTTMAMCEDIPLVELSGISLFDNLSNRVFVTEDATLATGFLAGNFNVSYSTLLRIYKMFHKDTVKTTIPLLFNFVVQY